MSLQPPLPLPFSPHTPAARFWADILMWLFSMWFPSTCILHTSYCGRKVGHVLLLCYLLYLEPVNTVLFVLPFCRLSLKAKNHFSYAHCDRFSPFLPPGPKLINLLETEDSNVQVSSTTWVFCGILSSCIGKNAFPTLPQNWTAILRSLHLSTSVTASYTYCGLAKPESTKAKNILSSFQRDALGQRWESS